MPLCNELLITLLLCAVLLLFYFLIISLDHVLRIEKPLMTSSILTMRVVAINVGSIAIVLLKTKEIDMSGTILLKSNQNRNQNQKVPAGTYLNPLGSF